MYCVRLEWPGGEDEPVAAEPVRVRRVVPQHVLVEQVGRGRQADRRARGGRCRPSRRRRRPGPGRCRRPAGPGRSSRPVWARGAFAFTAPHFRPEPAARVSCRTRSGVHAWRGMPGRCGRRAVAAVVGPCVPSLQRTRVPAAGRDARGRGVSDRSHTAGPAIRRRRRAPRRTSRPRRWPARPHPAGHERSPQRVRLSSPLPVDDAGASAASTPGAAARRSPSRRAARWPRCAATVGRLRRADQAARSSSCCWSPRSRR